MKNKILKSLIISLTAISLFACSQNKASENKTNETKLTKESQNTENTSDKAFKIGVLQLVQHEALDQSNAGFFKALDDEKISYVADQQNAGGELSTTQTIAQKLVDDKNDLIFAIATPAAQAVAGLTDSIPIVITAVTDAKDAGLVESTEKSNNNITGTSDMAPIEAQMQLIKDLLPEAKKVGILASSGESNSAIQIKLAKEACSSLGLEASEFTVSNLNEIQSVVESMVGKVDVIFTPTDNLIASGMTTISMIATENNIPIIGAEAAHVKNGALASFGIDYFELGYLAGQQAVKILKDNQKPTDLPLLGMPKEKCSLEVNEEVAKKLNIDISKLKK